MMTTEDNLNHLLENNCILPAVVIQNPKHAVPMAKALVRGGLSIMEVAVRQPHAFECIRRIRDEVPELTVGAGTLLTPRQIDQAMDAGASFGLSPGFNPTTVRESEARGFPFIPGAATAGEIEKALEHGCTTVKIFPIEPLGGLAYLNSIEGPFRHTGLQLLPMGGVNPNNLSTYLQHPMVIAVGGSWLTESDAAKSGRWDVITTRTQQALESASAPNLDKRV